MYIKKILIEHYIQGEEKGYFVIEPSWEDIQNALEKLNQNEYPYIWFYCSKYAEEHDIPELEIVGGRGMYAIQLHINKKDIQYVNLDSKNDQLVDIWVSDQGASIKEKNVCFDFQTVEKVAKYFYEKGQIPSFTDWENI